MSAALLTAMPARLPSATSVSASAGPKAAVRFAHTRITPSRRPALNGTAIAARIPSSRAALSRTASCVSASSSR